MTQNCRDTNTNCIKTAKTHKPKDLHQHKQKQKIQNADTNCKHRYKVKLRTDTKSNCIKTAKKYTHTRTYRSVPRRGRGRPGRTGTRARTWPAPARSTTTETGCATPSQTQLNTWAARIIWFVFIFSTIILIYFQLTVRASDGLRLLETTSSNASNKEKGRIEWFVFRIQYWFQEWCWIKIDYF